MTLAPGTRLQRRYLLGEALGEGAAATTYAAHDQVMDQPVALKVLHAPAPALIEALHGELQRMRGVWHPCLARALDLGVDREADDLPRWFLAQERVDGVPLGQHARAIDDGAQLKQAVVDTLSALGFLHRLGTRHGDVKPDNILVRRDGHAVLIDLGCARSLSLGRDLQPAGTPAFMAPELLQGDAVDARADLYALGKSLLALAVSWPPALRELFQAMCATTPAQRPTSAVEALERMGSAHTTPWFAGRSPRVFDRDGQLQAAQRLHEALLGRQASARALLLHGPSGSGRSRVLDEIKWRAQTRGAVLVARPGAANALSEALQRATGDALPPRTLPEVLDARDRLQRVNAPLMILLDDVDRLDEAEQSWWQGILRTTTTDGALMWVATSLQPHERSDGVAQLGLGALGREAVAQWADGRVGAEGLDALLRWTGGFPAHVQRVIDRLRSGELREADLIAGQLSALDGSFTVADDSVPMRDVLCWLCVHPWVSPSRLTHPTHAQAMSLLLARGDVIEDAHGFRLRRAMDAAAIAQQLPPTLVQAEHARAATLATHDAQRAHHWLGAGDVVRAREAVISTRAHSVRDARRWLASVDALIGLNASDPALRLAAAHLALEAGEPQRALQHCACVLRARPSRSDRSDAHCLAADAYMQRGAHARAARQLERAAQQDVTTQHVVIDERRARLSIQRGDYPQAVDAAQRALGRTSDPSLRARLHESLGVAFTYLGQHDAARAALHEAERLHSSADVRAHFRCMSYRAMLDLRQTRLRDAAIGYGRALRLAETHGTADLYVNAALNVGSVSHLLGDWGPMLDIYERAMPLAQALGKTSTLASLRFNLANLYADIGLFERSRAALATCQTLIAHDEHHVLQPYVARLQGELNAFAAPGEASANFERALTLFAARSATREQIEVHIELALLSLRAGAMDSCLQRLDQLEPTLATLDAPDVTARAGWVRAQALIRGPRPAEALPWLERALDLARASEQRPLIVKVLIALHDAYATVGMSEAARSQRAEAQLVVSRIAATLDPSVREAFLLHPERAALRDDSPRAHTPDSSPPSPALAPRFDLAGFLEINRRINSALSVQEVLSHAMDAAIALTGAERGFLLLSPGPEARSDDVEVSVARNVDREHLGKAHMKFSRSIADEVMRTTEPLLTIDAGTDTRFAAQHSVHSMKLKSVVCVPIRAPAGVLGALYLDNRFERARFRQEDIEVLMAFSDQVAIAITNARLHAELERRTRELDEERKRVERLARGQAVEIDRLQDALAQRQQVLELRHDYSSIVCRSAAMRDVLSTLDRVTDSTLSVLIQGESGTGKEVMARALHFNGPRRKQPFVSINCGALPEPLLESELFGHVKGAFTGADRDRAGLFVTARGGTLLLDEVGEMSTAMQVKLLRVLQEREVRRVGASKTESVDVRVLAATNRNLQAEVAAGRFREDLYYRLAVVDVTLPPLRERVDDIAELAQRLLLRLSESAGRTPPRLSSAASAALLTYPWPGNVRELENVLSRALVMCEGDTIDAADLALGARRQRRSARDRDSYEQDEASRLFAALNAHRWNVSAVSRQLGIPRNTLYRKLQRYRLTRAPEVDDG